MSESRSVTIHIAFDVEIPEGADLWQIFEAEGLGYGRAVTGVTLDGTECDKLRITDLRHEGVDGITEEEWLAAFRMGQQSS